MKKFIPEWDGHIKVAKRGFVTSTGTVMYLFK